MALSETNGPSNRAADGPEPPPRVHAGEAVSLSMPLGPDREQTARERLVTAFSSCYVYVVGHTALEPCRFELDRDGRGYCYVDGALQWEVVMPSPAFDQFDRVVRAWQEGIIPNCAQVESIRLGEPRLLPSGRRCVDILPAGTKRRPALDELE